MNKDFWERIDRLEELAKLFVDDKVSYGTYIAAANPAMIKEMIAEIRRLEEEADWLAEKLADASGSMFDDEMKDLGFECSHECEQSGCTFECRKINWRDSAIKAIKGKG